MYARVGVVTGANKGVGLAIVRQLALHYPKSPLNSGPLLIYLTSRDRARGDAALESLLGDDQLRRSKALSSYGGPSDIRWHALDITIGESLETFCDNLKKLHSSGVDFVINNAGMAMEGFDSNVVRTTLNCNYYRTLVASHAFLTYLKPGGRLVNVASSVGKLGRYPDALRARFLASRTEADVTQLMREFEAAVDAGDFAQRGWPGAAYAVSKAGLIGATRALAHAEHDKGSGVLVNSCCPGWVRTDMTKGRGTKLPDEGAQTPVMLALEDIQGRYGLFWQNEQPLEWG